MRGVPAGANSLAAIRGPWSRRLSSRLAPSNQGAIETDACEIDRGQDQKRLYPEGRRKRIGDSRGGGGGPDGGEEAGERAEPGYAEGMHRKNRHEGKKNEDGDDGKRDERRGVKREQIEQDDVPDRREADEIALLRLAVAIGDVEQAR